jgi:hypothetical protein
MDMATGVEMFRTDVVADAELTGFDGRIFEVTTGTGRELFDIESGETFTAPPALTEPAPFWTVLLASLDNIAMDYDEAQLIAGDLATQHAVETGVLWSDGFASLNPGYWTVFTGHFATQEEADAYCEALDTDCYPRYVATADIDGPSYYRYGDDGLYRVAEGTETQLVAAPVTWAIDDLMGGVVFRHPGEVSSDVWWLPAGATEPELVPVTGVWDAALVDGRPMLLVTIEDPQWQYCPNEEFMGPPVMLHDLETRDQTFLFCHGYSPDGGLHSTSLGDDTIASVVRVEVGGRSTDWRILFRDLSGQEVMVDTNPIAGPCEPCSLTTEMSDDGSLLAYTLWPTAFWDVPVLEIGYEAAWAEWKAIAETVPTEAAVVDLASGGELWRTTLDPGVGLADFDGRYLVISSSGFTEPWHGPTDFGPTASVIYDTRGIREPIEVDGDVALMRRALTAPATSDLVMRHDGLGVVSFGDPVDDVIAVLAELLGPPDEVYSQNSPEVDVSVQWDHPFLYLQFSYWDRYFYAAPQPPDPMPAGPVFHYYLAKSEAFATEAGIAVGDSVGDLEAAYPSVWFGYDCGSPETTFTIDPPADGWFRLPMWGLLSGEPTNDGTTIEYIGAGWDRSPC